jgi:hypothetical protein
MSLNSSILYYIENNPITLPPPLRLPAGRQGGGLRWGGDNPSYSPPPSPSPIKGEGNCCYFHGSCLPAVGRGGQLAMNNLFRI